MTAIHQLNGWESFIFCTESNLHGIVHGSWGEKRCFCQVREPATSGRSGALPGVWGLLWGIYSHCVGANGRAPLIFLWHWKLVVWDSLFLGTRSSALCVHPSPTIGLLSFLLYRHPLPRRLLPGNAKCISTLTSLPSARIEISLLPPSLPPHLQGITSPDSSEFSRGCCKRW